MSTFLKGKSYIVATIFLILALLLTIIPLPNMIREMRPQWVALLVIFWIMAYPEQFGVFWALICGLLVDLISGSLIGQHGISFVIMGFLVLTLQPRLRMLNVLQQPFFVLILLLVEHVLTLWLMIATSQPVPPVSFWLPCLIGYLLWLIINRFLPSLGVPEK